MRLLIKVLKKLVLFAVMMSLMGFVAKCGWRFAMQATGMKVSSEESDLMGTVYDSALKLVSGSAKKEDLAQELSDKLYAGRASSEEMKELGIEMVRPGAKPSAVPSGTAPTAARPAGPAATPAGGLNVAASPFGSKSPVDDLKKKVPVTVLEKLWDRLRDQRAGLALIPAAFVGMVVVRRIRRKPSKLEEFLPLVAAMQNSGDAEAYEMKHRVQALGTEDFELLVALIYQRQGYRVSMSAGLSGGRGGDFSIARKAEQTLVQCKKMACEHTVAVERVRELHEAMVAANFTRGMYVSTARFSWDARHFAKTKNITLINGRTLDQLLDAAQQPEDTDLLTVAGWAPKLLQKVTLTPALCPTCDAAMDEVAANGQTVWLCKQRPDCRGRRSARKHRKPAPGSASASVPAPAAVPEKKSSPQQPIQAKTEVPEKPVLRGTVPPSVPENAPPPTPEQEGCRPAAVRSVVPRNRSVSRGGLERRAVSAITTSFAKLPASKPKGKGGTPGRS